MLIKNSNLVLAFTLIIGFANSSMEASDSLDEAPPIRMPYVMSKSEMDELPSLQLEVAVSRRPFLIINAAFKQAATKGHQKIMEWILLDSEIKPSQESINFVYVNAAIKRREGLMRWMLALPQGGGAPDNNGLSAAYYEGPAACCVIL